MKKLLFLLCFLMIGQNAEASLPATDNFNRASLGTNWTTSGYANVDNVIYAITTLGGVAASLSGDYWTPTHSRTISIHRLSILEQAQDKKARLLECQEHKDIGWMSIQMVAILSESRN